VIRTDMSSNGECTPLSVRQHDLEPSTVLMSSSRLGSKKRELWRAYIGPFSLLFVSFRHFHCDQHICCANFVKFSLLIALSSCVSKHPLQSLVLSALSLHADRSLAVCRSTTTDT
jgi:hypothetical protein